MAARTRRIFHDENTRKKIQASQLINRLQDHALGKVELSQSQIKSIEVLLKKTLPDLSAVQQEVTGIDGGPMETKWTVEFVNATPEGQSET